MLGAFYFVNSILFPFNRNMSWGVLLPSHHARLIRGLTDFVLHVGRGLLLHIADLPQKCIFVE